MKGRLFSLDVLRGLDMLLLVAIGPLIRRSHEAWHWCSPWFIGQFRHNWSGFTLWDIIMPLFIFMCGAAIPFALGKRLAEGKSIFWKHVLVRVAMLWFLGGLVQGQWASLDPLKMAPYANTLQAIAVGYLVTAAVMCVQNRTFAIAVTVVMALVYTLFLAFGGDYSEFGNAAFKFELPIRQAIYPAGHVRLAKPSYYTWFPTSLMFAVMTLCGYFATEILRSAWSERRKAATLFVYAVALLALGFGVSPWIPVIKPIYTLSFTALAMGWSVLALALLYILCDILMVRRGWWLVLLFGQVALTAYFVSNFFRPVLKAFGETVAQGVLPHLAKNTQAFVLEIFIVLGTIGVMYVWRIIKESRKCRKQTDANS
jgi:predicted acyltransferase